jgi:hypothetical protein
MTQTLLFVIGALEIYSFLFGKTKKKNKPILVTVQGGPWGCEASRLPRFIDDRLTDGGEVVGLSTGRLLPPERCLVLIFVRG